MRRLNVTVNCYASYESSIMVPADMSLRDAIKYARDHINEINVGELQYLPWGNEEIDEFNSSFDDNPTPCRTGCISLIVRQEDRDDEPFGFCGAYKGRYVGSMDDINCGNCQCIKE